MLTQWSQDSVITSRRNIINVWCKPWKKDKQIIYSSEIYCDTKLVSEFMVVKLRTLRLTVKLSLFLGITQLALQIEVSHQNFQTDD